MTRLFWLSFCDGDKPKGEQFLGACVISVTEAEAESMSGELAVRFPHAQGGAKWIAAATRKAHALGCNPGGQVLSVDITYGPQDEIEKYPVGVLLTKADIEQRGEIMTFAELEQER